MSHFQTTTPPSRSNACKNTIWKRPDFKNPHRRVKTRAWSKKTSVGSPCFLVVADSPIQVAERCHFQRIFSAKGLGPVVWGPVGPGIRVYPSYGDGENYLGASRMNPKPHGPAPMNLFGDIHVYIKSIYIYIRIYNWHWGWNIAMQRNPRFCTKCDVYYQESCWLFRISGVWVLFSTNQSTTLCIWSNVSCCSIVILHSKRDTW